MCGRAPRMRRRMRRPHVSLHNALLLPGLDAVLLSQRLDSPPPPTGPVCLASSHRLVLPQPPSVCAHLSGWWFSMQATQCIMRLLSVEFRALLPVPCSRSVRTPYVVFWLPAGVTTVVYSRRFPTHSQPEPFTIQGQRTDMATWSGVIPCVSCILPCAFRACLAVFVACFASVSCARSLILALCGKCVAAACAHHGCRLHHLLILPRILLTAVRFFVAFACQSAFCLIARYLHQGSK